MIVFCPRSHALRGNACLHRSAGRGASLKAFPRRAWEREAEVLNLTGTIYAVF